MIQRPLLLSLLAIALAVSACARSSGPPKRQVLIEGIADERARLEDERDRNPNSIDARIALGEVYYRTAREFLDLEHDEERYLIFLGRSVDEFVAAVELDPSDERPHFYLAMMDVYQGDIKKAMRGFENALKLEPSGVAYTNIAEVFVYMDQSEKAQTWNDRGWRSGAPYSAVLFNKMLIAWRDGDLPEAKRIFAQLRDRYPEALRTINVARLPYAPDRFEGFARYCCNSPACGPYMTEPCQSLGFTVEDRELTAAAALKQLRIEMEKTRRLREIYRQHKELEVEIEGAEPTPP
jgi:tetratricopeptide (TPR) repeat protein